jgi:CHAT domain-containing protein
MSDPPEHLFLGCHGVFEPSEPLESGLELADGRLTIAQLINDIRLPFTKLVTLCACQTAISDFSDMPDEAVGLPAGILQAGAHAVVATLWSVAALPTVLLLRHFYNLIEQGVRTAEALRKSINWLRTMKQPDLQVQLNELSQLASPEIQLLLNEQAGAFQGSTPFINPIYWAAFTYTGPMASLQ